MLCDYYAQYVQAKLAILEKRVRRLMFSILMSNVFLSLINIIKMKHISNMLEFIIKVCCALVYFMSFYSSAQVIGEGSEVYISVDQGVNWEKTGVGLPVDASINVWVVKNNKIIAGTNSHGVYISSDKVKSWYPSGKGLPKNVRITAMVAYKHFLFAGTHLHGIYFSDDEGESWKPANTGITNLTIRSFYTSGSLLLVGTNDGIYRAFNDGILWTAEKKGMQVNAFAASGNEIFVASNQGVFVSEDFGETWDWIYKDGAIYKLGAGKKEIYLLDFLGNVYQSGITNFVWIKADVYLPFRYTFQLTPLSVKFFTVDWKYTLKNLGNLDQVPRFNGLPENSAFTELLSTPFGLLATRGSRNGC
ncbi:MAG: hypothetical protein C0490_06560 [Marivirga sp.]|nr:hypothetical protein [Marivirga sp.]